MTDEPTSALLTHLPIPALVTEEALVTETEEPIPRPRPTPTPLPHHLHPPAYSAPSATASYCMLFWRFTDWGGWYLAPRPCFLFPTSVLQLG